MDEHIVPEISESQKVLQQKIGEGGIVAAVAEEALAEWDPMIFLSDLLRHGCISGMASSLVRYSQTRAFYDQHYFEIEDLRYEFEAESIAPAVKGDLKNFYAWLAFEEVARQLADELGLER